MTIIDLITDEYSKACKKFKPFNSPHEGYAIIKEELDELWMEVKKKKHDKSRMARESIQLAAMALRFLTDICQLDKEDSNGRNKSNINR